ncbi:MAG TPA: aminoglycoside phosphotransferase family protein [Candidatus Saccharimonadales bacterium]|nr:aminoglycoside phosphotransferase family protein [Candidatus Saccharimonadales bacterium]
MNNEALHLTPGQMAYATRIDDTVHRATGEWTPAVHHLLRYLDKKKFEGVPRVLGIDRHGREMLAFIEGDAGFFSLSKTTPANLWSDEALSEAAQFLRRFHDITAHYKPPKNAHWQISDPTNPQVICHNDFAPYNCIFENGHFKAVVDFDTVGPGPRISDIAFAAYSFLPLFSNEKRKWVGLPANTDLARRLRIFCDAYGIEYCNGIVEAIIKRVQEQRQWVRDQAARGEPRSVAKVEEGHIEGYEEDLMFIIDQKDRLETAMLH